MKLLLDENLSDRIIPRIGDLYPDSNGRSQKIESDEGDRVFSSSEGAIAVFVDLLVLLPFSVGSAIVHAFYS